MTTFLFRFRGELLAGWGIAAAVLAWPAKGCLTSLPLLLGGIALRIWARRHIGPHSRGRNLSCPERSTEGPYRFMRHPLYVANLLVVASIALSLTGPTWQFLVVLSGPSILYAFLASAENRFVAASNAPVRSTIHDSVSGKWRSEWASTIPQACVWLLLQFLSQS
jgi:protein-S-isoprenylcysteine O-methyltransferase Ste14